MNAVHCGVSVSELFCVFIGSMVVTYILHICNVGYICTVGYFYASAIWVECLVLYLFPLC